MTSHEATRWSSAFKGHEVYYLPVTRAYVYTRVSLDQTGERLAVTRQREACLAIVAARGWTLAGSHEDNSISASDSQKARPGYDALCRDFAAGLFDALVVWDLDRLTRQPRQLEDWIDAAEGRGLAIVTANGEADLTTDAGRLFARIKAAVARSEVERKSARQSAAQRQRAELGRPAKGIRPTGYTLQGEVIEAEAQVVRELFSRFAAGDSLLGLTTWLVESGVPSRRGGRWNQSSVRGILTNARYIGRSIYAGRDVGEAQWEPIIDVATFHAVQARLSDPRRRTQTGTARRHLGSGVYECECGLTIRASSGLIYRGEHVHRYTCRSACFYRSGPQVDMFVLAVIRARLAQPDLVGLLTQPADRGQLRALAEERAQLRHRLSTVEADYDAGLIDGRRLKAATDTANTRLDEIAREEARLGASSPVLSARDPVAAFDAAPLAIRQRTVGLLARIVLHPGARGRQRLDPSTVDVIWRNS